MFISLQKSPVISVEKLPVKIKEIVGKSEIEYLRLALSITEIPASYEICDLIRMLQAKLNKKKGNFTVKDAVEIRRAWENKWNKYHEENKNEENQDG